MNAWSWWGPGGAAVAGLAGVATAFVLALHLIGRRPRTFEVPFLSLWTDVVTGAPRSRGLRLAAVPALIVRLALVGCLAGAIGDPRPRPDAFDTRVVLLDRSASMRAEGRWEAARTAALRLVDDLPVGAHVALATFGTTLDVVVPPTADREVVRSALAALAPASEREDLARALGDGVRTGAGRVELVVVSDGAHVLPEVPAGSAGVRFVGIGDPADNLAIAEIAAERFPSEIAVFARVTSHADRARGGALVVVDEGGKTLAATNLTLAPGEERRVRLTVAAGDAAQRLEARLRPDGTDGRRDDNVFGFTIPERRRRRVLVVGGANLYLDAALLALADRIVVERRPAQSADEAVSLAPAYDLVVWDGVSPSKPPGRGNFLWFAPSGPASPLRVRGDVRAPLATRVDTGHPLVRDVSLVDLNVARARVLEPTTDAVTIVDSLRGPLVATRTLGAATHVVFAFDPRRSDLPLRPAFPLLIANAIELGARPPGDERAASEAPHVDTDLRARPALSVGGRPAPAPQPASPRGEPRRALLVGALALLALERIGSARRWWTP